MHQFKIGDRVVIKVAPHSPIRPGTKGIVEWVPHGNPSEIHVRTDRGNLFRVSARRLQFEHVYSPDGLLRTPS